jgi:hypothetical protein
VESEYSLSTPIAFRVGVSMPPARTYFVFTNGIGEPGHLRLSPSYPFPYSELSIARGLSARLLFLGASPGRFDVFVDVDVVSIKEEDAESDLVRGGWKICDFAPDRRGVAPASRWVEMLNAPGMGEVFEYVIVGY